MKKVKHFTDLIVWQRSHGLFLDLLEDVKEIPANVISRIIIDQIVRSVSAISSNIAEGFNSRSTKQYLNYLDISKRTSAESENWYYKLRDAKFLEKDIAEKRITECNEISMMIQGLINSLEKNKRI
ncbi:MAG: four helix bundle protein [Nitrospirota bacterium]